MNLGYLRPLLFDVLLFRFNLLFQLLDLVVEYELELFQFLVFLFQIIDAPFLYNNGQCISENSPDAT